jgi:hypothetical protein
LLDYVVTLEQKNANMFCGNSLQKGVLFPPPKVLNKATRFIFTHVSQWNKIQACACALCGQLAPVFLGGWFWDMHPQGGGSRPQLSPKKKHVHRGNIVAGFVSPGFPQWFPVLRNGSNG